MNISFPDDTYRALLKEANHRDMPMAKLCSELLQIAAKIIEKNKKTENQRGFNDSRDNRK
ncbi:MAG: hypothetical protein DI535_27095 [Citrobacter freundii]|uniref:hypothetical protein n=1 Tax=Citrobacter TaxID=544 RepID=UPI000778D805|nr:MULTISPECIES: hypothetical protein [Citrobacter]EJR7282050.1 hypothetical protein [Citrobacter freundii]EKT9246087.1 hypothetical protein [Citrobacter freundii]EKW8509738.1 hypothetical protein [Citrobacter freundii]EMB4318358.1 hypothetical protein [Citrobacter freundii]KYC28012.1 hypothetical protein WM44_03920 [Citrobacter sp. AATXQ]